MSRPMLAHYTRVAVCPNGCPIIILSDEAQDAIIEAHIRPDTLEALIADLRRARDEGEAMRRPPA
jgi:hypothetical protein